MQASVYLDVGGVLVFVGITLIIQTLIISFVEAIVMLLLKWGKFGRILWVSLCMNLISTIFGGVLFMNWLFVTTESQLKRLTKFMNPFLMLSGLFRAPKNPSAIEECISLAIAFVLSVLIEGGILILFRRGAARQNWFASLIANIASYLLIILPAAWFK
jgi:hypothetical protein